MSQNKNFLRSIFPGVLLAVAAAMVIFQIIQNTSLKSQTKQQRLLIAQQSQLMDSLKIRSLSNLMPVVLSKIDEELKDNPTRTLSDETISIIASASHTFKPYAYIEGDSLSTRSLSPERGQLLLILTSLDLDSTSFHRIKEATSFAHADLRGVNLSGSDLSLSDLSSADLYGANLIGANLSRANLSFANLWGAQLGNAILDSADLSRVDLKWSYLNGANLRQVNLFEADLSSAQMRRTDLKGAEMKYAILKGTFLNDAKLDSADLYRTIAVRAQLPGASMKETNLTFSNLIEANLKGADLTDVRMKDSIWFQTLNKWLVTGSKEIEAGYKLVKEEINGEPFYRVKKKDE